MVIDTGVYGTEVTIDRRTMTAVLRLPSGLCAAFPWPADRLEETSAIERVTYELGASVVRFETRTGDRLEAELPQAGRGAPLDGRPVIYLDQNHWSTLARTLYQPETVRSAEREAAEFLIALVDRRRVVLPMSSAHMGETCQWTDHTRRYQLALTILKLSRGWQLSDPLVLRNRELRQSLATSAGMQRLSPAAPITLEPGAVHAGREPRLPSEPELPLEFALAARALSSVSTTFDVMLDAEPVFPLPVPEWAEKLQRFTDWLATEPRDPVQRRNRTKVAFLSDLRHELALAATQLGLTQAELAAWFEPLGDETIAKMPSLGIFREILHEKLLNPSTSWEENDLIDMMYMSCATAYADFVVAERNLTSHLRNALRRLGRPQMVYRSLVELAPILGDRELS